jgi:hypothetical protein
MAFGLLLCPRILLGVYLEKGSPGSIGMVVVTSAAGSKVRLSAFLIPAGKKVCSQALSSGYGFKVLPTFGED